MAKIKKQDPQKTELKKTEIVLSELVSGKLIKLQQVKQQADKEITDLIDIVLAEKASDIKPGTKVTISPDFKKISF